ncbi:MAG: DUF642 domain-containing protein, partial [Verrucomicrobiota bacterium]
VEDRTPPMLTCANTAVALQASGNGGASATITPEDVLAGAVDACDNELALTVTPNRLTCDHAGTVQTVTLIATDDCGNRAQCSADVQVTDPNNLCAPAELVLDGPPDMTLACRDDVSTNATGSASATTLCRTPCAEDVPPGPNLVVNTGFEEGTYVNDTDYFVLIDGWPSEITDWTVLGDVYWGDEANPYFIAASEGSRLMDLTGGVGLPGGTVSQTLPTMAGNRYRLTFDFGSNEDSPWPQHAGPVSVRATVGNVSQVFDHVPDHQEDEWTTGEWVFTATSASTLLRFQGAAGLSHIGLDNVSVVRVGAPPEPCPPEIVMTETFLEGDCEEDMLISRVWTATDACHNSVSCTQLISVLDRTAPEIICPEDITMECDDSTVPELTGVPVATDDCSPTGRIDLAFVDAMEPCEVLCRGASRIRRTWTGLDACGNSVSCTQTITQLDTTAPVMTCPPDLTIECSDELSPEVTGAPTVIDHCSPTSLLAVTFRDVLVDGQGGGARSKPGYAKQTRCHEPILERVWTVVDDCGNASVCTQRISLVDTVAPTFLDMPESFEVACNLTEPASLAGEDDKSADSGCPDPLPTEIPPVPEVRAVDPCDTQVDVAFDEIQMGLCPGVIVRTWTATDDCGNASELIQLIVLRKTCVNTVAYWKEHPEEWFTPFGPLREFDVGCGVNPIGPEQALEILNDRRGREDWHIRLAQELIAAVLNVAQGADDSCTTETIQDARDLLCAVSAGRPSLSAAQKTAKTLALTLYAFNKGNCCAPRCDEDSARVGP